MHDSSTDRTLLALVLLAATPAPVRAGELWAITRDLDQVCLIDTSTGLASVVGTVGHAYGGLEFGPGGELFAVDRDWTDMGLWKLDPTTSTATLVGTTGGPGAEGALVYDPTSGQFFSKWHGMGGGTSQELIALDPATGAATLIGNLGLDLPADVSGLVVLPDGSMLGYDPQSALPSRLLSIDKATAAVTEIGLIGDADFGSSVGGLAYDADTDTLYMSNGVELWIVDPSTGAGTLVGAHGPVDVVTGLSVKREPPPACLLGLDLSSTLFNIDPLSGAGSWPRPLADSKFGGLALSPAGILYGLRAAPVPTLFTIDQVTGLATLVGPLGILHEEGGLDFHPLTGELYGVGGVSELFRIDTGTGAATVLGAIVDELGGPIDPSAVAFDALGNCFVVKAASAPPEIYHVDPADGSVLARVPLVGLPLEFYAGLAFDDSTGLCYLSWAGTLYRVDPYSGASIALGPTPARSALELVGTCGLPPPVAITPRPIGVPVSTWSL